MTGAQTASVVAVKIFREEQMIAPVRVGLEDRAITEERSATGGIAEEKAGETALEIQAHLPEIQAMAGTGGALHLEVVTEEVVVFLQGFDEQLSYPEEREQSGGHRPGFG